MCMSGAWAGITEHLSLSMCIAWASSQHGRLEVIRFLKWWLVSQGLVFQEAPGGSFTTFYEVPESYFHFILLPKQVTEASLDSGEEGQTPPLNKRMKKRWQSFLSYHAYIMLKIKTFNRKFNLMYGLQSTPCLSFLSPIAMNIQPLGNSLPGLLLLSFLCHSSN